MLYKGICTGQYLSCGKTRGSSQLSTSWYWEKINDYGRKFVKIMFRRFELYTELKVKKFRLYEKIGYKIFKTKKNHG